MDRDAEAARILAEATRLEAGPGLPKKTSTMDNLAMQKLNTLAGPIAG